MPMPWMFAFLCPLFFFCSSLSAQEIDAEKKLLRWMDRIAQKQLDARANRLSGVEVLAARPDVGAATIRAVAQDVAGVWLLMAAAVDKSADSSVDRSNTSHSLLAALERPLHKNLHAAVIPGFCLKWDLDDLRKATVPRSVLWTDPTDWLGNVVPLAGGYRYRGFEEGDDRIMDDLMRCEDLRFE